MKFTVDFRGEKNRCAISRGCYKSGEIMLIEEPYLMIVDEKHSNFNCSHCGISFDDGSIFCVDANVSNRYCSTTCLTADYTIHKNEISVLTDFNYVQPESGNNPFRLAIRIFSNQINDNPSSALNDNVHDEPFVTLGRINSYSQVCTLESKVKIIDAEALQHCNSLMNIYNKSTITNKPSNTSEITKILSIIQTNAHYIVDDNNNPIALGLFPMTSMLNHSCQPNCAHHFIIEQGSPPKLIMMAIEDINEGDELCYSYIPLYQSTEKRREQLLNAYDFLCDCPRCTQQLSSRISLTVTNDTSNNQSFDNIISKNNISDEISTELDDIMFDDRCIDNIITSSDSSKLFLTLNNKLISNTEDCEHLLSKSYENIKVEYDEFDDAFRALLALLSSSLFISNKDLCHIDVVRAYTTISNTSLYILRNYVDQTSEVAINEQIFDNSVKVAYCKCALVYSCLALGCIYQFTNASSSQLECANLEYNIAFSLKEIYSNDWHNEDLTFSLLPSLNISLKNKEIVKQQFLELVISCLETIFAKCLDKRVPYIIRKSFTHAAKFLTEEDSSLIVLFADSSLSTLKLYSSSNTSSSCCSSLADKNPLPSPQLVSSSSSSSSNNSKRNSSSFKKILELENLKKCSIVLGEKIVSEK